jgi:putative FmdB family regulatory protein
MPVYEYRCLKCGENFDKLVRVTPRSETEVTCPKCQSNQLERKLSTMARLGSHVFASGCDSISFG